MTDCRRIMDSGASVFYAAGLPAIVSIGITICYFFLKICSFTFHAISNQAKRRVAKATTSGGQQEHCTDPREEGNTEIHEQIEKYCRNKTIWQKA